MNGFKKKAVGCPQWVLDGVRRKRLEATNYTESIPDVSQQTENGSGSTRECQTVETTEKC